MNRIRILLYKIGIVSAILYAGISNISAQQVITLSLEHAIQIATTSSLKSQNSHIAYQESYWDYVSYMANRLPAINLSLTPATYKSYLTQRYDSENNTDVFRSQKMFESFGGLNISQNVNFLGGTFYVQSNLDYLRNFGSTKMTQFSSIPVRVGYSQDLIGFNKFKWEKQIEPLKFHIADKQYVYNRELISEEVVELFFDMAMAQSKYDLAVKNVSNADTLYVTGQRKFEIASISKSDLLTLELEKLNAYNTLESCKIELKKSQSSLVSYLGLEKDTELSIILPANPILREIPIEDAISMALENNPSIQKCKQTILESKKDLQQTKLESKFNLSINASVGFNQVADNIVDAYHSPMRQDLVSISLSTPLVDWGVRKGRVNMAHSALALAENSAEQQEQDIIESVIIAIDDLVRHEGVVTAAKKAIDIADLAYAQTQERFLSGKCDINALLLSSNRQEQANVNFIQAMKNYWLAYYKIRRLTLYDFQMQQPLINENGQTYHLFLR